MTKVFKIVKDKLVVTITEGADIIIPGEKDKVGNYTQQTIQYIDKDKAHVLQDYVNGEMEKAQTQRISLIKQYEPIKDIIDLDPAIVAATKKALEKGTKTFKDKAIHLSNHIAKMNNKQQLKTQIDYIDAQIVEIQKDVDGLKEAIK